MYTHDVVIQALGFLVPLLWTLSYQLAVVVLLFRIWQELRWWNTRREAAARWMRAMTGSRQSEESTAAAGTDQAAADNGRS